MSSRCLQSMPKNDVVGMRTECSGAAALLLCAGGILALVLSSLSRPIFLLVNIPMPV
ncbi:MAG: hypothetical protein ACJA07_002282 [Rhodococcus sp. (in: high G+C Gram-positive bacteria)]